MKDRKANNYLRLRDATDTHDLGLLRAECDENLAFYYVSPEKYVSRALNFDSNATFFIGPKGVGKSAILKMVEIEGKKKGTRVVHIRPDDLAFATLADLKNQSPILQDANRHQWLFKTLWDYVLTLEVLRSEYPDAINRRSWLSSFFKGPYEISANKLIAESEKEGETLTGRMLQMIREVELSAGTPAGPITGRVKLESAPPLASNSIPLLNLVNTVSKKMRTQLNHKYYVLIDDLDQYWTDNPTQNAFIAALFTSLTHFSRPPSIKAVVALRDNIYRVLPLVDGDKAPDRNVSVKWDAESVRQMIESRLSFKYAVGARDIWGGMFPENAFAVIAKHTCGRPRESIRIAGLAVGIAVENGHKHVESDDLVAAIKEFSSERLRDICAEVQSVFPSLDLIVRKLSGGKKELSYAEIKDFFEQRFLEVVCNDPSSERYAWIRGYEDNLNGIIELFLSLFIFQIKLGKRDDPKNYDPNTPQEITADRWFAVHSSLCPVLGLGLS